MFNLTLKMRETILFFLIMVINGLICTRANIRLDKFQINNLFIGE